MAKSNKIEDFGNKIGGARKDVWKSRNLEVKDIIEMTDLEQEKYVVKNNIWKAPDYKKMVEEGGIPKRVVFFIKQIRDSLPAKPKYNNEESRNDYISYVSEIRDKTMSLRTENEVELYFQDFIVENYTDGYNHENEERTHGYLTNKLFKAAQVGHNFTWLDRAMKKKQFLYSEEDRILENYDILHLDENQLQINKGNNGKSVIKYTNGNNVRYMYGANEYFTNLNNWKPDTYFIIKSGVLIDNNYSTYEEAKDFVIQREKNLEAISRANIDNEKHRKKKYVPEPLEHIERSSIDFRNDQDIKGSDMLDRFGFYGGEFGNWLNENDRQHNLNYSFDAFSDLAYALNISVKDISLGGKLSIAYGARGKSSALAHFEPERNVINLTKLKGAGSLAHEWGHAFDFFMAQELLKYKCKYISETDNDFIKPLIGAITFKQLSDDNRFVWTDYYKSSKKMDRLYAKEDKGYWSSTTEMFARAFACYVMDKLNPYRSDYLCGHAESAFSYDNAGNSFYAYPQGEERETINKAFDEIFDKLREKGIFKANEQVLREKEAKEEKEASNEIVKNYKQDYKLLSRLKCDCEYYLGAGQRNNKHLWADTPQEHIEKMKELYASLPEKPEWLSEVDIQNYEKEMIINNEKKLEVGDVIKTNDVIYGDVYGVVREANTIDTGVALHITNYLDTSLTKDVSSSIVSMDTLSKTGFEYIGKETELKGEQLSLFEEKKPEPQKAEESEQNYKITQNDFYILRQIKPRKSVLNFSDDEIKLTENWAMRFDDDINKKSPFFRAKNGEWRDKEQNRVPIINIEDKKSDYISIKTDVKNMTIERGNFINNDTGWQIQVSRAGLEDSIRYAFKHNDAVPYNMLYYVKEIVENGILLDSQITDENKNNKAHNTAFMHKMYGICKVYNQPCIAKISVEEFSDSKSSTLKRLYNLQDIKIEPLRIIGLTENQLRPSVLNDPDISISDLFSIVKTYDKDFYMNSPDYSLSNENNQNNSAPDIVNFKYTDNQSGITITEYIGSNEKIIIPAEIDGKKVTAIGENAFANFTELQEVVISENIAQIEAGAFYYCENLEKVKLPDNLKTIAEDAFYGCQRLSQVIVPKDCSYDVFSFSQNTVITSEVNPTIEFTQVGSFYEAYDDSASALAKEFDTHIFNKGNKEMVGIADFAIDKYITALKERGYEVSIKQKEKEPEETVSKDDDNLIITNGLKR